MDFLQLALQWLAPLLGTAIAGLVVWFLKNKLHLQLSAQQEHALVQIVEKAIAFAEEWANKQIKLKAVPTGAEKLEQAVNFAQAEIKRVGLKINIEPAQLKSLLEAALPMARKKAST